MTIKYSIRYSSSPEDVKHYTTERLRKDFLIQNIMLPGEISMVYSHFDRFITGGAVPTTDSLKLESIDPLKASFFLERRELGIINVGASGKVTVDGEVFELGFKEALYVGRDCKEVIFFSNDAKSPAHFYFNSTTAHAKYPNKRITLKDAEIVEAGSLEGSNARRINKLLVNSVVKTCQLQMGMTELQAGSVWNTMPPHVHDRRMEVYFYFNIPEKHAVCHFMGEMNETRHVWVHNEEAVISPDWSIHSGAGTNNYIFIWGMAGENLDYSDMDSASATDLL